MPAQPSKWQCNISKILSVLILNLFLEQNIFLPGMYFAIGIRNWFCRGFVPGDRDKGRQEEQLYLFVCISITNENLVTKWDKNWHVTFFTHVRWLALPAAPLCSIVECAGWREIQNSIYWMGKVGSTCLMEYAFVLFSLSLQSALSFFLCCSFTYWEFFK